MRRPPRVVILATVTGRTVALLLLRYLESKDQSEADRRFAEVASAWGLPANRNRQGGLSLETGFQIPGQNWFGDWEDNR